MDLRSIVSVFARAKEAGASDVHLVADAPVMFRIDGLLVPQTQERLTQAQTTAFARGILDDAAFKRFQDEWEVDTVHTSSDGTRFRVNLHFERERIGIVARVLPAAIPALTDIGLRNVAGKIRSLRHGLVLLSGPTGSGKSTSLAAIITAIHADRPVHTVTLEDPIEFLLHPAQGIIRQRQYGQDFHSFPEALKRVLRQNPDVIMIGELRDPETVATALTLAETGHLILATLHTPNTIQAANRIIDVFPPPQQHQIRSQLALSLQMVIAQRLIPKAEGGRTVLYEVLINSPASATMIRENRLQELTSVLQTGQKLGMCTFDMCAAGLYKDGVITKETWESIRQSV